MKPKTQATIKRVERLKAMGDSYKREKLFYQWLKDGTLKQHDFSWAIKELYTKENSTWIKPKKRKPSRKRV